VEFGNGGGSERREVAVRELLEELLVTGERDDVAALLLLRADFGEGEAVAFLEAVEIALRVAKLGVTLGEIGGGFGKALLRGVAVLGGEREASLRGEGFLGSASLPCPGARPYRPRVPLARRDCSRRAADSAGGTRGRRWREGCGGAAMWH
jgi:hypothetical protein